MIQRIDTNARMSHIVVHAGVAYLAGAIASDLGAGIAEQTRQLFRTLKHHWHAWAAARIVF